MRSIQLPGCRQRQRRGRCSFPLDWAMTQNHLGNAYLYLPSGDRQTNLQPAIACYQAALQVLTREAFPVEWAMTQNHLGLADADLPGGDREANLKQAIACYQAAVPILSLTHMDDYAEVVSSNLEAAQKALQQLEEGGPVSG
jgi:tetratricopeptide (TPR) repeat protein